MKEISAKGDPPGTSAAAADLKRAAGRPQGAGSGFGIQIARVAEPSRAVQPLLDPPGRLAEFHAERFFRADPKRAETTLRRKVELHSLFSRWYAILCVFRADVAKFPRIISELNASDIARIGRQRTVPMLQIKLTCCLCTAIYIDGVGGFQWHRGFSKGD